MNKLLSLVMVFGLAAGCGGSDGDGSDVARDVEPFDHGYADYSALLEEYVGGGLVDYKGLKENRGLLDSLVEAFGAVSLSKADDDQKLAFYINAYNLITLRSIVDAYPVESIKDIDGVWDKKKWAVAGKKMTLDHIEHKVIRKKFKEPRIHFAIVCASIGCPPIVPYAYHPDFLDTQLDEAARKFVTSDEYNRIDPVAGTAMLSSLFDWFGEDFQSKYHDGSVFTSLSKKENSVLNFVIAHYPEAQRDVLRNSKYRITYLNYDWSLNDLK